MNVVRVGNQKVVVTRTVNQAIRTGLHEVSIKTTTTKTVRSAGNRTTITGRGLSGPVGPKGDQGDKGDVGDKGDKGDTGDQGDRGPTGSGVQFLERAFASPVLVWSWTHNLNTYAIEVNAFELGGLVEKPAVPEFVDANTVQIEWFYPETGVIRLLY